jgi:hypothetical protein
MDNFKDKKFQNEKGQLTIFLGVVLMVVITALAFIINVGLFVKAKINLQNAVDAGAFSGASVQARRLTKIAYLNWEMRNTYKEYMFKFYILGQLGIQSQLQSPFSGGTGMSFRLKPFFDSRDTDASSLGNEAIDPHNVPSTCIHFGSENNICGIYDVPGIPRFNTVGLPSITPMQESFLNTITQVKASNCSRRSDINFGVAMVWAYGTGSSLFSDAPQIAADRVGAWPQAFELAVRTRNIEFLMNTPPLTGGICNEGGSCGNTIGTLNSVNTDNRFPINERPIKAFLSAYANLGGGDFKESPENANVFSRDFVLTELPPNELIIEKQSLSGYLIPNTSGDIRKYYVDLQLWPVNLATFYTTFVNEASSESTVAGAQAEATCKGSKTALPLPSYLMGFTKNPEVVTYYAVKGETKFVGMFYPFTDRTGIPLAAYGAAKPFGGRIGPKLFGTDDNKVVTARKSTDAMSVPYFSTVEVDDSGSTPGENYKPGFLIPYNKEFWVEGESDAIGGIPSAGTDIKFVVPNLLYNTQNLGNMLAANSTAAGGNLQMLVDAKKLGGGARGEYDNPSENVGLYDKSQYAAFISNLQAPPAGSTAVLTSIQINQSLALARAPTNYEVANYMIPTMADFDTGKEYAVPHPAFNSNTSTIPSAGGTGGNIKRYRIYAPIVGPGTLYETPAALSVEVADFMDANSTSIESYLESLAFVAKQMKNAGASNRGGADSYNQAAATIHDKPDSPTAPVLPTDCSGVSMAAKFNQFFAGSSEQCDIKPLKELIQEYVATSTGASDSFAGFYDTTYENHVVGNNADMMTAFFPGPLGSTEPDGATQAVLDSRPATGVSSTPYSLRNFYSTKFVSVQSLTNSGPGYFNGSDSFKSIFSESPNYGSSEADTKPGQTGFSNGRNFLDTSLIDDFKRNGQFDF